MAAQIRPGKAFVAPFSSIELLDLKWRRNYSSRSSEQIFQFIAKQLETLISGSSLRLQTPLDHRPQDAIHPRQRCQLVSVYQGQAGVARHHLIQHDPERVHVRAYVSSVSPQDFRRYVARRASHLSLSYTQHRKPATFCILLRRRRQTLRQLHIHALIQDSRQTEVGDLYTSDGDHLVVRNDLG